MGFRQSGFRHIFPVAISVLLVGFGYLSRGGIFARAQVFVVGEKSAMAGVSTEFHPTRIELPSKPLDERGRRELVRNLEAEQGFAHRPLPLADTVTLVANGNLSPSGDSYNQVLYKRGQFAQPGDRVAITRVVFKGNVILLDLNGGPYLKHRFLRHIQLNDMPLVADDGAQVSGCRIALVFEGGIPEVSAPEVKALLDPLIDFGVKSSSQAYADTLPPFLREAIAEHNVLVGMDRRMVLAAMGAPQSKVRELVPGSTTRHYEEWIYGQVPQSVRFIRFVGDHVVQVRIAAPGQPIAVRSKNEMQGYVDPEDTHEIAMGDVENADQDAARAAPPTILKPGESAPGSSRRVLLPPPESKSGADSTPDRSSSQSSTGTQASPGNPSTDPAAMADPPESRLIAARQNRD